MARVKFTTKKQELAFKLAEAGKSDTEIMKIIKISKSAYYAWLRNEPEARKRLDQIRDDEITEKAEQALRKRIEGGFVEEEKRTVFKGNDGKETIKVEKIKKYIPPDTTAVIFALKNIRPSKWNDRRDLTISGLEEGILIQIQDPRKEQNEES